MRWEIRSANGNAVVWSRDGHDNVVDGSALAPGSYVITFEATAHGDTVRDSRAITVKALPPGHTKPVVTISKPAAGKVYYTGGAAVQVQLKGSAVDQEDGVLSGTRFQWVATAGDKTGHPVHRLVLQGPDRQRRPRRRAQGLRQRDGRPRGVAPGPG